MYKRDFIIFFIIFSTLNFFAMFDIFDIKTQVILKLVALSLLPIFLIYILIKKYINDKKYVKKQPSVTEDEDFNKLYNKLNSLKQIENYSTNSIKNISLFFIFLALTIIFITLLCSSIAKLIIDGSTTITILKIIVFAIFTISSFIGYIINLAKYFKYKFNYLETYSNQIIPSFFNLAYPTLNYSPTIKKHSDIFYDIVTNYTLAHFEPTQIDEVQADDLISISQNDYNLTACNLNIFNVDNDNKVTSLFYGMYAFINCKNIHSSIIISTANIEKFNYLPLVHLDSISFENNFNVYSEDKLLTMRILTSDTMEYLTEFYEKYGIHFQIVIKNNYIHIRFFTAELFSHNLFNPKKFKERLYFYYIVLQFITKLSKKINETLNNLEI